MSSLQSYVLALFFGAVSAGCTFYTSCPADGSPGDGDGQGGTGNSGSGGANGNIAGAPPEGEWTNVTANLAREPSECGNLAYVKAPPEGDVVIAGVGLLGVGNADNEDVAAWWASRNGGESWEPLGLEGGDIVKSRPAALLFDPEDPRRFWVSGTYGAGGLYRTDDGGETFHALGSVTHSDYVAVDFSDPERRTLLASGHEQGHRLYLSRNAGEDWEEIGDNLPDDTNACNFPWVIDEDRFLFGCSRDGDGVGGIFRSSDGGDSWARVADVAGAFGPPTLASSGALYWSTTDGLAKSENDGEDWSVISTGLDGHQVVELPDGRLAAMARFVVVSGDDGETWRPVAPEPPFQPNGFTYSPAQKAFFVWHATCEDRVPSDAIMRFDFDYEAD